MKCNYHTHSRLCGHAVGELEAQQFENWKVADAQGRLLGSVSKGSVQIPMEEFNVPLCLIDPTGKIHAFKPLEG